MKRAIGVIMCAVIVVTLLAVSTTPLAAGSSAQLTGSFSKSGGTVNYLVKAWRDGSGYLQGLTSATLKSDFWTSSTLRIAAGVAVTVDDPERPDAWWYTFPAYCGQKSLNVWNGQKTDMVYAPQGFTAMRSLRVYLRMLLIANWPVTDIPTTC
jgi:hypothetical protein